MFGMSFFTKQEGHGVRISLCGNSVDILFIASNCFAFFTLNCGTLDIGSVEKILRLYSQHLKHLCIRDRGLFVNISHFQIS